MALVLKVRDHVLKIPVRLADERLRLADDKVRKPELFGDGKCIALPGDSHQQPVRRL